jgi:hypothetical protein
MTEPPVFIVSSCYDCTVQIIIQSVRYRTVRYCTVLYCMYRGQCGPGDSVQYSTVQLCTVQYSMSASYHWHDCTVLYHTVLYAAAAARRHWHHDTSDDSESSQYYSTGRCGGTVTLAHWQYCIIVVNLNIELCLNLEPRRVVGLQRVPASAMKCTRA